MGGLVDTLIKQHNGIRHVCDSLLSWVDSGFSTQDVWEDGDKELASHLDEFKRLLLEHLALEDKELLPALLSSHNETTVEVAKRYAKVMKLISKKATSFMDSFSSQKTRDLAQDDEFKMNLGGIIMVLKNRMDIEEHELYPLYSKD